MYKLNIFSCIAFTIFIIIGCNRKIYDFDRALPVKSPYSKEVTSIMSKRQKKYYQNIAAAIKEERGLTIVAAIASAKNGKVNDDFLQYQSGYVRFSKYETAEHRQNLLMANERILKGVKEMNFTPAKVYWSPVASPGFAAFTTPLQLLNSRFSDGALVEISNAIESNLTNMSYVLLNLVAETSEKFDNNTSSQVVKFRTKGQIDSLFSKEKYFQHSFNANLLEYFFYEKKTESDSAFALHDNMTGLMVGDEALLFICSHEYAHVLLKHVHSLQPLRFSPEDTSVMSKNSIPIGEVSISNEFSADSLGLLLCRRQTYGFIAAATAVALIWLDITERIQAAKYNYVVYLTHPPAKERLNALSRQMQRLGMDDETLKSFFYCYELLWKDFNSVLQKRLKSNSVFKE
jgi:hypothetical protein